MSRTARLLRRGQAKMAKKLAEEAIEVVIDAMKGDSQAVVRESADLLYNLAVVWAACGRPPAGYLGRDGPARAAARNRREAAEIAEDRRQRSRRSASPSPRPPWPRAVRWSRWTRAAPRSGVDRRRLQQALALRDFHFPHPALPGSRPPHAETFVRLVYRLGRQALRGLDPRPRLFRGEFVLSGSARRDADPDGAGAAAQGLAVRCGLHGHLGRRRRARLRDRRAALRFRSAAGSSSSMATATRSKRSARNMPSTAHGSSF